MRNTQHPAPSTQHHTQSAKRKAQSAKRKAQSAKRKAQSAKYGDNPSSAIAAGFSGYRQFYAAPCKKPALADFLENSQRELGG